jgi:hypothetical protein
MAPGIGKLSKEKKQKNRDCSPYPVFRRRLKSFRVSPGGERWTIERERFARRWRRVAVVGLGGVAHQVFDRRW